MADGGQKLVLAATGLLDLKLGLLQSCGARNDFFFQLFVELTQCRLCLLALGIDLCEIDLRCR